MKALMSKWNVFLGVLLLLPGLGMAEGVDELPADV